MREMSRRDGCVAVYDDDDGQDLIIVEPLMLGLAPVPGNAHCICGAPLQRWSWRHVTADAVEIGCDRCHRAIAFIRLGGAALAGVNHEPA
jgi:hypothetical protein